MYTLLNARWSIDLSNTTNAHARSAAFTNGRLVQHKRTRFSTLALSRAVANHQQRTYMKGQYSPIRRSVMGRMAGFVRISLLARAPSVVHVANKTWKARLHTICANPDATTA